MVGRHNLTNKITVRCLCVKRHLTEKSNQDTGNVINDIKNKYAGIKERNPNRKDPNETPKFQPFRVIGVISESFEPYMQSYVNNEEIKIKET